MADSFYARPCAGRPALKALGESWLATALVFGPDVADEVHGSTAPCRPARVQPQRSYGNGHARKQRRKSRRGVQ